MLTNAVIENILSRRSIRSFTDERVPADVLETIATCGQWAPSACNQQEWHFIVLDDADKVASLAEVMRPALGRDEYDMYKPAAAIVVGHAKSAKFAREDDGCAMQTMMLAAHSLSVASVWINQLQDICDEPSVRAYLSELGLEQDFEVHGVCALGYAAADGRDNERKSVVTWA